ncbi:MAG: methionine--tRNA ligase subunit beta, partial [Desulfosalsimonas sp.]
SKMSKSLGNVIDPIELKDTYGVDAIRYFLMREMTFGLDSSFSEAALIQRINSDLANDLGNLFSRVLAMFHKYFKGTVPDWNPEAGEILGTDLKAGAKITIDAFCRSMENLDFHKALAAVWEYIGQMNKFVDTSAPWELAKQEQGRPQLAGVICHLLEGLRVVAGLIYPVMPETAAAMQKHLGQDSEAGPGFYLVEEISKWGVIAPQTILPKAISLFPRLDPEAILNRPAQSPGPEKQPTESMPPQIGIEDFARVDLRAARVISAEKVAKADKLLKLEVDIGRETRTVVAGIAKLYAPEDLVGKTVILVANLKPTKLMGIRSEGMVLAAVDKQDGSVAVVDRPVPPGTRLK